MKKVVLSSYRKRSEEEDKGIKGWKICPNPKCKSKVYPGRKQCPKCFTDVTGVKEEK